VQKIFVTILFLLMIVISNSQTVILEEDFENASSLPPGWDEITSSGFHEWSYSEAGNSHYLVIPFHSNIAYLNEGDDDRLLPGEYLVTPNLNLSNCSAAFLSADVFFKSMSFQNETETFSIEASTDGGNTWTTISNIEGYFNWHKIFIDISAYCGMQNVKIAFKYSDSNGWLYGVGIDNVRVVAPFTNDGALKNINNYNFVLLNDTTKIKGVVQNMGANIIHSLDISWRANEGNTFTQNLSSISLSPLDTFHFSHSIPWLPSTQEAFDVKVWISCVNGIQDEDPSNDTLSMHVTNAVSSKPEKSILLEVFGATWCTICPHAASVLSSINSSSDKLIVAVVHVDDPFTCDAGIEIFENYHLFPGWLVTGLIDRFDFNNDVSMDMDRYLWPWFVNQREDAISPVDLTVSNIYYPSTRELDINLTAIFRCDLMGDFRFNCYLVEDSIVSGQDNVLTIPDREPYCHKDYWVYNPPGTIENYIHMNVLHDVLGGTWGSAGSLPNYVIDGQAYEYQYNYTVPDSFNSNNLRIIGIVQKFNTDSSKCEVYNAKDLALEYCTITDNNDPDRKRLLLYPNPALTKIYFTRYLNGTSVSIISMHGQVLSNKQITGNHIDIRDLKEGIYLLQVNTGNTIVTQKFIKY